MKALLLLALVAGAAHAADMVRLDYEDQEPGAAPYPTRILVTRDFLRMDDGDDGGDFVLLDRKRHAVVNVLRSAGVAMVFRRGRVPQPPPRWKAVKAVTPVAGGSRVRVRVGGVECSDVTTARGVFPDAVAALRELKTVLAERQYATWQATPPELQHDCDLANQVWEFAAALRYGLPVSERDFSGRTRHLRAHATLPQATSLFAVPADVVVRDAPPL
jgi:hypothetical protein